MWTSAYLLAWFRAFAFTQIVEAPLYRRALGVSWMKALAPSAITHPLVWFFFPHLLRYRLHLSYTSYVVVVEMFAWLAEALFLALAARIPGRRAVVVSLAVNAASFSLGLLSHALFGVP